jgi:steroid delta-isomerase-like uncharacterized protein
MAEQYETLIHRWFEEVWNQGRSEVIDEMFASAGIAHGLTDQQGNELRGPEGYKPFFESFRKAFPDIRVIVEDTVSEGDKVAARCRVEGTHSGEGLGVAPTGNRVAFTGMTIIRVKEGKIVEAWNNFDFLTMSQQIGKS